MITRTLKHLLVASALAASGAWAGNDMAPDELVAKMTADVLDAVQSDKQLQAGDKQKALQLAESKILPLVDFRRMTMLAAGDSGVLYSQSTLPSRAYSRTTLSNNWGTI